MNPRGSFLSRPWLVTLTSLGAILFLVVLLWRPWDRRLGQSAKTLHIYCAAGISKPVAEIIADYEQAYGAKVQGDFGGSGVLLSKIKIAEGRGDLYVSADAFHIDAARKDGLVAEVLPLGTLRPVLVVNSQTLASIERQGLKLGAFKDVLDSDLKFVLANPKLASIGQLTKEILVKAGLWSKVEDRLKAASALASTVDTVNDVTQIVRARTGYAGVIWSANADQFSDLHVLPMPELTGKSELLQVGVLTRSEAPTAALRLARYLAAADKGAQIFRKHHYEPMKDADIWEETPTIELSAGAMLLPGIDHVVKAFAQREGAEVRTRYAGCGLLVGQMKAVMAGDQSAHFPDAYFACDESFLDDVQEWFEAGVTLSRNPIVLVVPKGNSHKIHGLADLARPELRVGLAHPQNSALGKLTDDLLRKLGIHEAVYADKRRQPIVHTDAAHLLVNQMRVGALDVAVVYKSNVMSAAGGREQLDVIDINLPDAVARQPFAIARQSPHKYLMRRLLQAIVAPESAEHFRSLGFAWTYEAK